MQNIPRGELQKMRIILTGASGLIGSRFEELMFDNNEIIPLSSKLGINLTDKDSILNFLSDKEADAIVHLAAKTDVDGCELDKEEDLQNLACEEQELSNLNFGEIDSSLWKYKNTAFAINTMGTKNLYEVTREKGIKFVYISTDFVFSGHDEFATEETLPHPVDWYGATKYFGERLIDANYDLIVRLSYPFGYPSPVKKDFFWKLYDLLSARDEVSLVSDQTITPTFIDDVVNGIVFLLQQEKSGVYHLTGSSSMSPKAIGEKIKETYGLTTEINEIGLEELYKGKAPRPSRSIMKNEKITNLGFRAKTFDEGLALISAK